MSSSPHLTNTQLRELREAFDIFDSDHSGNISIKEMETAFKTLGINASKSEIRAVIKQMDKDGDGEISFEEFVKIMGPQFYRKYTSKEIRDAFRHFDKDNNGYITAQELKSCLTQMGRKYTDREIARMIKSVDADGNGMISIDEFVLLLES